MKAEFYRDDEDGGMEKVEFSTEDGLTDSLKIILEESDPKLERHVHVNGDGIVVDIVCKESGEVVDSTWETHEEILSSEE